MNSGDSQGSMQESRSSGQQHYQQQEEEPLYINIKIQPEMHIQSVQEAAELVEMFLDEPGNEDIAEKYEYTGRFSRQDD